MANDIVKFDTNPPNFEDSNIWTPERFKARVDEYFDTTIHTEKKFQHTIRAGEKGYDEKKSVFGAPSIAGLCNFLGILEREFKVLITRGGAMGRVAEYANQRLEAELLEGMREGRFRNDVDNLMADVEKFKDYGNKGVKMRGGDGLGGLFSGATINMPQKLTIEVLHSNVSDPIPPLEQSIDVAAQIDIPNVPMGVSVDPSKQPPIALIERLSNGR